MEFKVCHIENFRSENVLHNRLDSEFDGAQTGNKIWGKGVQAAA
jgi:hypothetical protein